TIAESARRSVRVLERFARVFPVGRAEAERYEGREHLMSGKTERGLARLARAIETARAFDLPVEEARAHADLARFGPGVARERHRDLASALFTRAGTWGLLARMEAELDT
ncbi:MAG TPA: hypothetical protein VL400_03200, partial [Polyangiaceae bacterium]|nr:hypothetical protein [Polyangiaceae bacterium]